MPFAGILWTELSDPEESKENQIVCIIRNTEIQLMEFFSTILGLKGCWCLQMSVLLFVFLVFFFNYFFKVLQFVPMIVLFEDRVHSTLYMEITRDKKKSVTVGKKKNRDPKEKQEE